MSSKEFIKDYLERIFFLNMIYNVSMICYWRL